MMTVSLEDAQIHLKQLIEKLTPDEQWVILESGKPIATLARSGPQDWSCKAGSAKNSPHWMAPDFDAPLS